jgi:sugar diacid utilization regulator
MTIETINAFADASIKVTRAAAALHVHPNTVRYRIGRNSAASTASRTCSASSKSGFVVRLDSLCYTLTAYVAS